MKRSYNGLTRTNNLIGEKLKAELRIEVQRIVAEWKVTTSPKRKKALEKQFHGIIALIGDRQP